MPDVPLRGIADRSAVDVPSWAAHLRTGDTVRLDTEGEGVVEAEVLGFSLVDDTYGKPVVEVPDELADYFDDADVLVVREQDLADEPEVRTDGGHPEEGGAMTGSFRYATVVRSLEYDPRNEIEAGRILIVEGAHRDGWSYTVVDEENEGFRDIEHETLGVVGPAEYPMDKDAITSWAAETDEAKELAEAAS